jgi:hypothetical protein
VRACVQCQSVIQHVRSSQELPPLVRPKRLVVEFRGCSLPANASGFDPHRASISSRFGQELMHASDALARKKKEEASLRAEGRLLPGETDEEPLGGGGGGDGEGTFLHFD